DARAALCPGGAPPGGDRARRRPVRVLQAAQRADVGDLRRHRGEVRARARGRAAHARGPALGHEVNLTRNRLVAGVLAIVVASGALGWIVGSRITSPAEAAARAQAPTPSLI